MERLASIWDVPNETAVLKKNETKQQVFFTREPQPSEISGLGALEKCSYDTLSHIDLTHCLGVTLRCSIPYRLLIAQT